MCHYLGVGHNFTSHLLEKESWLRCVSLNILFHASDGVSAEETNHKRNKAAPGNVFTEEINLMEEKERGNVLKCVWAENERIHFRTDALNSISLS